MDNFHSNNKKKKKGPSEVEFTSKLSEKSLNLIEQNQEAQKEIIASYKKAQSEINSGVAKAISAIFLHIENFTNSLNENSYDIEEHSLFYIINKEIVQLKEYALQIDTNEITLDIFYHCLLGSKGIILSETNGAQIPDDLKEYVKRIIEEIYSIEECILVHEREREEIN